MRCKKDSARCNEWEKQRRDRLNESFKSLAKLLPNHDPAKNPAKIDVLERAAHFIKFLTKQIHPEDGTNVIIKESQEELNKLRLRVKQLTELLNQAKITIPKEPFLTALGEKGLKWSNQLSSDDLENSKVANAIGKSSHITRKLIRGGGRGGVKTITVIVSPLKETNAAPEVPSGSAEEIPVVSQIPTIVENASNTAIAEPCVPSKEKATIKIKTPVTPVTTSSIMTLATLQPTTMTTVTSNLSFPAQPTFILTRCPLPQVQPITIGGNPRLILKKAPLSAGNIPKIAIPPLKRPIKPTKPPKKRRKRLQFQGPRKVTKSCQTEQTETVQIVVSSEVKSIAPVPIVADPTSEPEPEPILVDISGPVEKEIQPDELVLENQDVQVPVTQNSSTVEVQQNSDISTSKTCSPNANIQTNDSLEIECSKQQVMAPNPEFTVTIEKEPISQEHETKKTDSKSAATKNSQPETSKDTSMEHSSKNMSRSNEIENIVVPEEPEQTQSMVSDACINSDKISECIARSIDLIDHPEAELMELGADWGVPVGEINSPKSPISPTQMFLSMFPLLPRESIVTAAGVDSTQQYAHPLSGVRNLSGHFAAACRSSFFIDSMLPDHIHPQGSGVSDIPSNPSMDNSICLAMTPLPITPCPQTTCVGLSHNNYPSPPSFQALANVLSNSANTSGKTSGKTSSKHTTAGYFQLGTGDRSNQSKGSQNSAKRSTAATSSSYEKFEASLQGIGSNKRSPTRHNYPPERVNSEKQPPSTNSSAHTISHMFNTETVANPQPPQQQEPTHSFNENFSFFSHDPSQEFHSHMSNHANRYSQPPQTGQECSGQVGVFRHVSNMFNPSQQSVVAGSNVNAGTGKTPDEVREMQRTNPQPEVSSNNNPMSCTRAPQRFPPSQYVQPLQKQQEPTNINTNFNFTQNHARNPNENLQGFPRQSDNNTNSEISNPSTLPQHPNIQFTPDFPPYTTQGPIPQEYQPSRHLQTANCPYGNPRQSQPVIPPPTTSNPNPIGPIPSTPKGTTYKMPQGQQQPPKSRRPPFYLPDPPPPPPCVVSRPPTSQSQCDVASSGNYGNQSSNNGSKRPQKVTQAKHRRPPYYLPDPPQLQPPIPHYESTPSTSLPNLPNYNQSTDFVSQQSTQCNVNHFNNFTPQFYSNAGGIGSSGTNKEYHQLFSNQHHQPMPKQGGNVDFYQNQNLPSMPTQSQQGQTQQQGSIEPPQPQPSMNPKKSVASNFSRVNAGGQQNQARPVNWMTDPPTMKKSTARNSTLVNPFSVSKLVGNNNSNNYCTEALIRKNPEWNDFHCFVPPIPPPVHSNPIQPPAYSLHLGSEYTPHAYHPNSNGNFENFDAHQQHYGGGSGPSHMNSQNQGQSNLTQPQGGTTTSLSNFNLSTIFPEINDKRSGSNNNTGGNCGYYPGNNVK